VVSVKSPTAEDMYIKPEPPVRRRLSTEALEMPPLVHTADGSVAEDWAALRRGETRLATKKRPLAVFSGPQKIRHSSDER
jgi:hypothetical protein